MDAAKVLDYIHITIASCHMQGRFSRLEQKMSNITHISNYMLTSAHKSVMSRHFINVIILWWSEKKKKCNDHVYVYIRETIKTAEQETAKKFIKGFPCCQSRVIATWKAA